MRRDIHDIAGAQHRGFLAGRSLTITEPGFNKLLQAAARNNPADDREDKDRCVSSDRAEFRNEPAQDPLPAVTRSRRPHRASRRVWPREQLQFLTRIFETGDFMTGIVASTGWAA